MKKIIGFILLIILFILGMLQSCKVSEQKKIDKAKIVAINHPNDFASICSQLFPVKESFIKGKDSIRTDTVTKTNTVTVTRVIKGDTVRVDVECPKEKVITRYVNRTDTVIKENTAKLEAVQIEFSKQNSLLNKTADELTEAKNASNKKNWWIGAFAFLFIGAIFVMWKTR
jgi:PBP1b-binding outer membrane lipoprotein LpoB